MAYETIVGRTKDDLEKFGTKAAGFIGKHIVGTGEDAHLTTRVLFDLLRPHIILISGKRGTGKCVEENTLVTLDDGSLISIKDLDGDNRYIYGLNSSLKISPLQKSKFFKRKVNKLLHIRLRSGREIKLTPEHPLLTINGWIDAKDLDVGSRVATARSIKSFGTKVMKEYEIKLLSYLIAEGHLRGNYVLFSNSDSDIFHEFSESVKKFNNNLRISQHSHKNCYRVSAKKKLVKGKIIRDNGGRFSEGTKIISENPLIVWLKGLGIYGKLSSEKFIPTEIFQLSDYQLSLFLNRLFSCDGSIYKNMCDGRYSWEISYSSSSKLLIHQVQHLLLRFDILSRIRNKIVKFGGKTFDSFELIITGANVVKFINKIGFFGRKKNKQEKALKEALKIIRNPNVDTIPKEVWDIYRPKNWAEIGRTLGYSIPKGLRGSINYAPSRQKLMRIAKIDGNEQMYILATSDIFWDEIVETKELHGEFKVCDISVPNYHTFLANDIIVHNSYDAGVIAEEIALLPEEYRNSLAVVFVDTMGIFWSTKRPNEQQSKLLQKWNLKPKGFECVKVFVPFKQKEEFERANIPVDAGISIAPYEFSADEWRLAFNLSPTDAVGIALEKNVNELLEAEKQFTIEDLITKIRDDRETSAAAKDALENMLTVANQWGVFGVKGANINEIVQPGQITIIDVSRLRATEAWSVRNFLVAIIARKIYNARVIARKKEEVAKLTGEKIEKSFPMTWLIIDECLPFDSNVTTNKGIIKIGELVERHQKGESFKVLGYNPKKEEYDFYDVTHSFEIKDRGMIEITTESGKKIKCTPNHMMLNKEGFLPAISASEVGISMYANYPKTRNLIKARIVGHLFGDGWLSSNTTEVGFSGKGCEEDLEVIKQDLLCLGFSSSNIYNRMTHSQITTVDKLTFDVLGRSQEFHSSTKSHNLFSRLGAPIGKKTITEFCVPKWVMKGTKEERIEFLAALMGSDGYLQSPLKKSPRSFPPIRFSFNKLIDLESNAFKYANQLKRLFEGLGVKVSSIKKRKGNIRKDGKKTAKLVITLSNSTKNMIRFLETIGFRYCREKESEGYLMLAYLRAKLKLLKERKKLYKKAKELQKKGLDKNKVAKILSISISDARYWLYYSKGNISTPRTFPTYKEWKRDRFKGNVLFEKIVKKESKKPEPLYDISVAKVHNFVSDSFIVHNCHNFCPADTETVSSEPLRTIAKQGREPGVSLVVMTQMPNKVHQDILSQCDLVFSHRLTSRDDLQALHSVMQTYHAKELWQYVNSLPRWPGAAIILDDNLEKIFTVQIRPRISWHAGGTAVVI